MASVGKQRGGGILHGLTVSVYIDRIHHLR